MSEVERNEFVSPHKRATEEVGDGREWTELENGTYVTGGNRPELVARPVQYYPDPYAGWHLRVQDSMRQSHERFAWIFRLLTLVTCLIVALCVAAALHMGL